VLLQTSCAGFRKGRHREVTPANKQEIDRIIHDLVGVTYKNCPAAWRQVKSRILEEEANFVLMLKDAWKNRKES
jgi:hypothetical protein